MTIVPSIDLRHGQVVRLKQGDYSQQLNYAVDPVAQARAYADAGAKWMHVVDLDGAKEGRPVQTELIRTIVSSTTLQVQTGGGVRTTQDIEQLLSSGVHRVVVGTRALEAWDWFKDLAYQRQMKGRLVLAVDARDGVIATRGWTQTSGRLAEDVAREVSDWGLGAILYTDVAKDGMMQGPNYQHTARLVQAGSTPVIASGGVGSIEHIHRLLSVGCWGVIVGRSLYEGTLDLRQAIQVASQSPAAG